MTRLKGDATILYGVIVFKHTLYLIRTIMLIPARYATVLVIASPRLFTGVLTTEDALRDGYLSCIACME